MSRHHHLTVLATAWWLTQDERYAEAAAAQLRSWWSANPFLSGVHWTSGIEAGIRLISWTWIRRLLDDWPKVGDLFEHNDDAVRQIGWHQEFLAAFPSRGSSANNHVIAEAAGRLVAACAFPWYARSSRMAGERRGAAGAGARRQHLRRRPQPGAGHRLPPLRARARAGGRAWRPTRTGTPLSEATWARLAQMLDAAAAIVDVTGRPPRQGDGDEGRALVVDDPERDPWATLLATGAALLGAPDWWPPLTGGVQALLCAALGRRRDGSRARRAATPVPRGRPGPAALARPRTARRSGAGAMAGRTASCPSRPTPTPTPSRWRCGTTASTSSPTRAPTATTASRTGGEWFRSTAAHNTVEIGGVSQSESGGPFLWNTQAADDHAGLRGRRRSRCRPGAPSTTATSG